MEEEENVWVSSYVHGIQLRHKNVIWGANVIQNQKTFFIAGGAIVGSGFIGLLNLGPIAVFLGSVGGAVTGLVLRSCNVTAE